MDLVLELNEIVEHLEDDKKRLLIEVARGFLSGDDDEVFPDDLYYIGLAEEELASGETISHNDINWK